MRSLADFIRTHRERILSEWERRTAQLPSARGLSREGRRDHMPQLLDAMTTAIEREDRTLTALQELPLVHADHRWAQDYDLAEIVAEYRVLRRVVFDVYVEAAQDLGDYARGRLPPLITFNENLDHAISDAVDHYTMQREQTREYFIGMLSHDLRDPLNTIALGSDAIARIDGLPEAARPIVARLLAASGRMRSLIDDMLDVTRSRLGPGIPITPVIVDLAPLVHDTVEALARAHPARRIESLGAAQGLEGCWDPLRVTQAVSNLLSNAIKHGTDPITARTTDEGDAVVLEVSNRGEIPAPLRAHVFEPFQTRDPQAGIGLGLYIASEVARAHGGELRLDCDTPGATTFRLSLPKRSACKEPRPMR